MFQTLPTFWAERIEILEFWILAIWGSRVLRALSTFFPLAMLAHLEKSSLNYPVNSIKYFFQLCFETWTAGEGV